MMYDVVIIGAGVIGASIAREISKYKLNILVLEKNNDVGDETSCANSAIIHSGYASEQRTLKAKLNSMGNPMFAKLCEELDVELERIGSLTIAMNSEESNILKILYTNGLKNGVDIEIVSRERLFEMEPYVTKKAIGALYAKDAGIINPFELVIALMENAIDNGLKLNLNEEVIDIKYKNYENNEYFYEVKTNKCIYKSKVVINCAGLYSDKINNFINNDKEIIKPRKGEYFVLDHFNEKYVSHILFSVPSSRGKGVLVTPTTSGNYLIGPSSEFVTEKDDISTDKSTLDYVINEAKRLVDYIPMQFLIREYSGLRAYHESDDFVINMPKRGFINLLGIQSPGLASSPAIAKEVIELVSKCIPLKHNENFNPKRRKLYRVNTLTIEERNKLIKKDFRFGEIVCRCEKVTLGEVVDSIHRNCGATTIKGVKKRVRPGAGVCQGGFCEPIILKVLANELGKNRLDINYSNEGSYVLKQETKCENNE